MLPHSTQQNRPAISSDDHVGKTTRFTGMVCSASSLLAHLWHPKRANERQLPTNTAGRRAWLDNGSGAQTPVPAAETEWPVSVQLADPRRDAREWARRC